MRTGLGHRLPPLALAAATCIGMLAVPGSSLAAHRFAAQPSGLTGEQLTATADGSSFFVPGTCYSGGPAQSRFSFSGTASGPYPGTYTATGTLSYTLRTVDSGGEIATGPLTGFSAKVTITSPTATVVLTERFDPALNADQDGHCDESAGGTSFATDALRPTYTAVITTARGRFRGRGSVDEALSSEVALGGSVSDSSETADLTSARPTHHSARVVSIHRGAPRDWWTRPWRGGRTGN